MKKAIKSFVLPVLISVVTGFVFAKVVYGIYQDNIDIRLSSSKIFLLKNGEYKTYEDMRQDNNYNNYVYYQDNDIYKSIVGITNDEENIDKMKEIFNLLLEVEEYYIAEYLIDDKQKEYDIKLKNTNDNKEIKLLVDDILNIYKKNDSITFILSK